MVGAQPLIRHNLTNVRLTNNPVLDETVSPDDGRFEDFGGQNEDHFADDMNAMDSSEDIDQAA